MASSSSRGGGPQQQGSEWSLDLGANIDGKGTEFRVWAPFAKRVQVAISSEGNGDDWRRVPLEGDGEGEGFHSGRVADVGAGVRYMYVLDGRTMMMRPDPVSRSQPAGVHGPSEIVDPSAFDWTDRGWKGVGARDLVVYEVHVGTYTREGTFGSLSTHLRYLTRELGITAIELMPVGQFPGSRNWGYDGVDIYAPQNSYGGPDGLKRLINACHEEGLAVLLDVVYNHLGPEGNYLGEFGPYFSYKYTTPWGAAINYDDRGCDQVRHFVVNNALYWVREYHLDGLRLDAIHGIFDFSPRNILLEIADNVHGQEVSLGRKLHVIGESDLNDPKVVSSKKEGGYALDAQWSDDFHHSVHAFLTGERFGYYQDFGGIGDIEKAIRDGFVYDGRYSRFRGRTHGAPSADLPGRKFVVCLQNHDQVGNRRDGARLSTLLTRAGLRAAVGLLILAPNVPLLFMGEEFGETAPFYYFISHGDRKLVKAVRDGRRKELEDRKDPRGAFVDPQDPTTFERSKVNHDLLQRRSNQQMLRYYRTLLRMRRDHPALGSMNREHTDVRTFEREKLISVRRWEPGVEELLLVYVLGRNAVPSGSFLIDAHWSCVFNWATMAEAADLSQDSNARGAMDLSQFPPFSLTIWSNTGYSRRRDVGGGGGGGGGGWSVNRLEK